MHPEDKAEQQRGVTAEAPAAPTLNRAARRRLVKTQRRHDTWPPRRISMVTGASDFDPDAAAAIATVAVRANLEAEPVIIPNCVEYDMDRGFASSRNGRRVYGIVLVTLK